MAKNILFLSDIHPGSRVSPLPPGIMDEGNEIIKPTKISTVLYEEWKKVCKWANNYKSLFGNKGIDKVFLVGDCGSDGENRKGFGLGAYTSDLNIQVNIVKRMLQDIKCKNYSGVGGSDYHAKVNMNTDKNLLIQLGEAGYNVYDDEGKLNFDFDYMFTAEDVSFHVRHWTNQTKSLEMYRSTPLARQIMQLLMAEKEFGKFDVIIRGHVHYYFDVGTNSHRAMTLPAWQGRYDMVKKYILGTSIFGAVIFTVNEDEFLWDKKTFKLAPEFNIKKEIMV